MGLIDGIANIAGSIINASSTNKQNRKSQQFSRDMYDRQFNDTVKLWGMTNEYNTPANQMKRFTAAGLNPNLIYGQAGDNSAASMAPPSVTKPDFTPSRVSERIGSDLMMLKLAEADMRIKQAQANNLNVQTGILESDHRLKLIKEKQDTFDYDYGVDTRGMNIDFLGSKVRGQDIANMTAINRDVREALMASYNVEEVAQKITNLIEQNKSFVLARGLSRAQTLEVYERIKQMEKDGTIKDFEIELNKQKMTKSDPLWARKVLQFLGLDFGDNSSNFIPHSSKFRPDGGHRQ